MGEGTQQTQDFQTFLLSTLELFVNIIGGWCNFKRFYNVQKSCILGNWGTSHPVVYSQSLGFE